MDGVKLGCGMFIVLPLLIIIGCIVVYALVSGSLSSSGSSSTSSSPLSTQEPAPVVTLDEYNQLQAGMSYRRVSAIIGAPGSEMSRVNITGYTTVMYAWTNPDGSNMNAMFQNGGMVQKAQFGLK